MKLYLNLLKYHFSLTMKSSKMMMPFLSWIIYMAVSYTILPLGVVSSIVLSSIFLFYIMTWFGINYYDIEDSVAEQIIVLKTKSHFKAYISNIIFLFCSGIVMSILGMAIPLILNIIHQFKMYTRPITMYDIIIGFLFHIMVSILAVSFSSLFHPRLIKNRKIALLTAFTIAIISLVKVSIIDNYPITKFILWILPPVSDYAALFAKQQSFPGMDVLKTILIFLLYTIVYLIIHLTLLIRKKF